MTLTIEQTNKILQKLRDYGFEIIDKEVGHKEQLDIFNIQTISEEYFNEKVNEGLEEEDEGYYETEQDAKETMESIDKEDEMRKCIDNDSEEFRIALKDNKNQPPQAQDKADLKCLYDKHNKEKES